jgi:hypothetical protein
MKGKVKAAVCWPVPAQRGELHRIEQRGDDFAGDCFRCHWRLFFGVQGRR